MAAVQPTRTLLTSLPLEVLFRIVSYVANPDQTQPEDVIYEGATHSVAVIVLSIFQVSRAIRRIARDCLALARLVELEYSGPAHLAPGINCKVLRSDQGTCSESRGIACAWSSVQVSRTVAFSSVPPTVVRLTLAEFTRYITRLGEYNCPVPPSFHPTLSHTSSAAFLGSFVCPHIAIKAEWKPYVFSHAGAVNIQPIGRYSVEQQLIRAFHSLESLLSWSSSSYVDMPHAFQSNQRRLAGLGYRPTGQGRNVSILDWLTARIAFFEEDYESRVREYNAMTAWVTAPDELYYIEPHGMSDHSIATFRLAQVATHLFANGPRP